MNNLITIAVTANKPELITSNRNFNVNSLITEGCGLTHFRNIIEEKFTPLACIGLSCKSCPFGYKEPNSNNADNQTIESMRQWLKLEPLEQSTKGVVIDTLLKCCSPEQSTQPNQKDIFKMLSELIYWYDEKSDVRPTKEYPTLHGYTFEQFEEWFNNNKKK